MSSYSVIPTKLLQRMLKFSSNNTDLINELERRGIQDPPFGEVPQERSPNVHNQPLTRSIGHPAAIDPDTVIRPNSWFDWDAYSKEHPHRVHKCTKECVK